MPQDTFGIVPPNKVWSYQAAVSGATSDSKHSLSWLVDGRGLFPLRVNSGTAALTVAKTAATVSVVALCNHRIKVNCVLTGGISGTIVPATAEVHDILLNPFLRVTPVSVSSLTLTITSNTEDIVIGELIAGELVEFPMPFWEKETFEEDDFSGDLDRLAGIPPYDEGEEGRTWTAEQIVTTAQLKTLRDCRKAQRGFSLPSLIIPELAVNDAWLGHVRVLGWSPAGGVGIWNVKFQIVEIVRSRW